MIFLFTCVVKVFGLGFIPIVFAEVLRCKIIFSHVRVKNRVILKGAYMADQDGPWQTKEYYGGLRQTDVDLGGPKTS